MGSGLVQLGLELYRTDCGFSFGDHAADRARIALCTASARITAGTTAAATSQPSSEGKLPPSNRANGGMPMNKNSAAISTATAPSSSGLPCQLSLPTHRTSLRQTNAVAICPRTTVVKAVPDAVASRASEGVPPQLQPPASRT